MYLEVGGVFFQMSLNATAQLKDPAPLSLKSCSESLQRNRIQTAGVSNNSLLIYICDDLLKLNKCVKFISYETS